MLAVNYLGPVRVIRAVLPHFFERHGGRIVNVASMLGFMGTFGYSAHAGCNYALSGLTEALRQDLLPRGTRVHIVLPADHQDIGARKGERGQTRRAGVRERPVDGFSRR